MKTPIFALIAAACAAIVPFQAAQAGPNTGLIDVSGVASFGSTPVSGVVGSGAQPGRTMRASFSPETQARINVIGATLSAENISGNQSVGGGMVNVDGMAAQALMAVVDSPAGSNSAAVSTLVTALGGGESALMLATSLQGLRSGTSIDAAVLSGAVGAYNSYLRSLISASNVVEVRPVSELEGFLQSLPSGQKATQVLLTRLLG
jgi:hypothetical protein